MKNWIYLFLLLVFFSCDSDLQVAELDGWESYNREILGEKENRYVTNALYFQVKNYRKADSVHAKSAINNFLKSSGFENKISHVVKNKPNNSIITCYLYKEKILSTYDYSPANSEDISDAGNFYDENNNLALSIIFKKDNGKVRKIYHFY